MKALLFLALASSLAAAPSTGIGIDDTGKVVQFPLPPPAVDTGTATVRTEPQLTAAISAGGSVLVPNAEIVLTQPLLITQPGTWLHGLGPMSRLTMGPGAGPSVDRVIYPKAPDCHISDLRIQGGPRKVVGVFMDGASRIADRLTIERCQFDGCAYAVVLTGAAVTNESDILEDFTFTDCAITNPLHGGIQMSWEMLRPRIQRNRLIGNSAATDFNALWIGLGVCDATITDNVFGKVGRMGIEVFYAHANPAGGTALVSKLHPNGPSVTASNNTIFDTGSFGESWAGCKHSRLSGDTITSATGIGVEFVDEDVTAPSQYTVEGYRVINTAGVGVSIDKIKSGRFSNILVDGVRLLSGYQMGVQIYHSDDVTMDGWTITGAGPRYVLPNASTRTNIVNCSFTAKMGEAFPGVEGGNFSLYCYGGSCYFNGNVIRGNATNPLRTALNGATVTTSPTAAPLTGYQPSFTDGDNLRQ